MQITFYSNKAERNRLDKTSFLTQKTSISGDFKNAQSIINPSILIEADSIILQCNYAYIDELNRYYFINSIETNTNNTYIINMSCDVLMTFKEEIKGIKAEIVRNQYITNSELFDNKKAFSEKREFEKININSNVFNVDNPTFNYVVITTKGGV